MAQAITIQSEGRRHYLVGNTYPIKDQLRSAGAKWDSDRKAWWTGKREVAEQFAGASAPSAEAAPASEPGREAPGTSAVVAGKAIYKGKTYYVAGRTERGRTQWDDRVNAITSRDGRSVLLYFRDGSRQFWAPVAQISGNVIRVGAPVPMTDGAQIVKTYDRPQTIGRLQRFAEEAKRARAEGNDDGIPNGATYECEECGERVVRGQGACWETGHAH